LSVVPLDDKYVGKAGSRRNYFWRRTPLLAVDVRKLVKLLSQPAHVAPRPFLQFSQQRALDSEPCFIGIKLGGFAGRGLIRQVCDWFCWWQRAVFYDCCRTPITG